jgi:hypothetical protein
MSEGGWTTYFEKTKNSKPRPLLVKAVELVQEKNEALDLGSGALNDVRYLVSVDFKHVTAVDSEPIAKDIIQFFPQEIVKYEISTFEDFMFEEGRYDLINAQYALPFNPKGTFAEVWTRIVSSLKNGGVITGQFFGTNDGWNTGTENMNFHTLEEATSLLADLDVAHFKEEEADKETAAGNMKHWHIFHFIAVKK